MLPNQKLSITEKIGYGLGDTATNLVWRTLMVFLPFFYTDVFGLTAAAVGTLLLVCRFMDGLTDFLMGIVADRTETRWGKFRPWVLWMALPFGVLTVLTFTTFDLGQTAKLVYAYVTYSALVLIFTASNVPYSALTGVLTADPIERTSVSSYRFFFAFLGGVIVQGFSIALVEFFGQGDDVVGYQYTMTVFAALAVALFVVTFLTTTETGTATRATRDHLSARFGRLVHKPGLVDPRRDRDPLCHVHHAETGCHDVLLPLFCGRRDSGGELTWSSVLSGRCSPLQPPNAWPSWWAGGGSSPTASP